MASISNFTRYLEDRRKYIPNFSTPIISIFCICRSELIWIPHQSTPFCPNGFSLGVRLYRRPWSLRAGSSFLTAQKTRGRAHRFFACHFLAYAQGGQSDRTPKGRKRSLCNVASTSTSAASRICSAERRPGNCSSRCRRRTWSSVGRSLKIQRARVAAPRSHSVAAASPQTRSAGAGAQQLRRHFRSRSVPGL